MNPTTTIHHPQAALAGGALTGTGHAGRRGSGCRTARSRPLILGGLALCFLLGGLFGADAVGAGEMPPSVLVLNAYHQGEDWSDNEIAGIIPVLRKRYPDLMPAVEHLDTKRFPHADHLGRMRDYLARKYRGRRIDLLLVLDNPALALVCERGTDLFAGVPVIFAGINGFHPEMVAGRKKVTGVVEHQDMAGTLRLAMQLQPEARRVLAVHDGTASGLALRREMETLIPQFAGKLEIAFSPAGAVDDLLREVAAFPRDGIVLLLTYVTDAAGRTLSREESTRLITSRSRAPVYAMHETRLGYGIAGGLLLEGGEHGKQAAALALRVLAGEDADRIPVQTSGSRTILDARVVSRLGIPEARWPAEAVVVNRPTSLWLEHRSVLIPALLAIGILSLGLILLLVTVRRMRRAEAELRESHQLNEQIIQSVNEGVIVYGADLRYKLWNPYMESLTGLSVRDVMGRHPLELFPFLRQSGAMERIERALAGETPPAVDFPFIFPGSSRSGWSSHKSAPLRNAAGQIVGVIATVRDITAYKQAEEALRQSERKFRDVFENIAVGILVQQRDGSVSEANPAAERILGVGREGLRSPEEINARLTLLRDDGTPWPAEEHPSIVTLKSGFPVRNAVMGVRVPGREGCRWINVNTVPHFRDGETAPQAVFITFDDITERKALEQERQAMAERLQRAEKMEALGTLAGGVAHDLNNVLGIVVGYAEMLLEQAAPADPQRQDLARIMDGGVRAAAIVQDLLALARRGVQNRKVLNLNAVVLACRQTPEFEKALLANPGIRVETDLEADLLNVTGSPVHLGKTLLNLVVNAVEAMPAGGVLTIATGNRYVDRPIQGYDQVRAGDYAVLAVTDTGEGISSGDLTRVFEPFYTKKVMGRSGTGLGLAVVWGTVKDHNGYIDVESQRGRGTTFTLYFPVTRDDAAAEEAAVPLTEYLGRGEAILVVDDVREQRELAARMLGRLGYAVATAASGEEAVAWLRERRADLVVLDMIMDPGMDGLETYRAILEIHPRQKAVIVSGFSETDRVNRAQALGVGAYVRKPYILERLGMAVRQELDDRRQRP